MNDKTTSQLIKEYEDLKKKVEEVDGNAENILSKLREEIFFKLELFKNTIWEYESLSGNLLTLMMKNDKDKSDKWKKNMSEYLGISTICYHNEEGYRLKIIMERDRNLYNSSYEGIQGNGYYKVIIEVNINSGNTIDLLKSKLKIRIKTDGFEKKILEKEKEILSFKTLLFVASEINK